MTLTLGIDTGGTYTDAVLVDHATAQVLRAAKALTTRRDLAIGIGQAIDVAFQQPSEEASLLDTEGGPLTMPQPVDVGLVALSTTLATNAIVEGQGSPVCLLLIGYDPALIRQYGFEDELVTDDVVYVDGGHNIHGDEAAPLDEAALCEAVLARRDRVEAFAVSSYFGVRNPSHELCARALIEDLTGLPVTCGHDLTTRLDSVRRATTVALNARLVPLLRELIETLRRTLAARAITAPLMVVKGDGSLVRAEWAMQRPIETILSGPAASAVGAGQLARQAGERIEHGALWVVDMGGTTTDIAVLHAGRPRLNPEGAQVGRWRTMVEAVDVHTVGLGGDSHVRLDGSRRLVIGPRRVVPLSLLADQHPEVLHELHSQAAAPPHPEVALQFLLPRRPPTRPLGQDELAILERLAQGPVSLASLVRDARYGIFLQQRAEALVAERLVLRAGFTPTDALHVLDRLDLWDTGAAKLGSQVLAAQGRLPPRDLCHQVVEGVSRRAAKALVSKALSDPRPGGGLGPPDWEGEPTAAFLLERALDGAPPDSPDGTPSGDPDDAPSGDLAFTLTLRRPVVAIGAPVAAYMPRVAERLNTRLIIPPHAEVANAVGAVAGGVIQRQQVLITPLEGGESLRLHMPQGVHDFDDLEEAVIYAWEQMRPWMEAQARQAGAGQVEVQMARRDASVKVRAGWGDELYLHTELTFTAVGRPSPATRTEAQAPSGQPQTGLRGEEASPSK